MLKISHPIITLMSPYLKDKSVAFAQQTLLRTREQVKDETACLHVAVPLIRTDLAMQERCVHLQVRRENSLFQNLLPLGWREGLQLQAGLVDEYDRQVEVRVPHLELTKNIYIYQYWFSGV